MVALFTRAQHLLAIQKSSVYYEQSDLDKNISRFIRDITLDK